MPNTIRCPKCGHVFPAPLASRELEKEIREEIQNESSLELHE